MTRLRNKSPGPRPSPRPPSAASSAPSARGRSRHEPGARVASRPTRRKPSRRRTGYGRSGRTSAAPLAVRECRPGPRATRPSKGQPMTTEGVDFANPRPSGAALKAAGKHFVIRYTSPNTTANPRKRLTAAEVRNYRSAGLDIGLVWETSTDRATQGRAAGVADAHAAETVRRALGI